MILLTKFTDDFNRADSSDLGASWDAGYSAFNLAVNTNGCQANSFSQDCIESYNAVALPDACWAEITLVNFVTNLFKMAVCYLRMAAPTTWTAYHFAVWMDTNTSDGHLEINKIVAGSHTVIGSFSGFTFANGDAVRGVCKDTVQRLYYNGVLRISTTDAAVSSGNTRAGIRIYDDYSTTPFRVDSISGGQISTAGGNMVTLFSSANRMSN